MEELLHEKITGSIITGFYKVYNELGYGFLEKVYHNSLLFELKRSGLICSSQMGIDVLYQGVKVGLYYADILVNNKVIIEIKAAEALVKAHEAQLINYLKATGIEVGLILNFGPIPDYRRKIFTIDL